MATYVTDADIKSNLKDGFDIDDYLDEGDSEVIDIAERRGVRDSDDIENDPLHYKLKRYVVVFVLMRLAQDKIGTNAVSDQMLEKYLVAYNLYKKEYEGLKTDITVEMVTGNVDERGDRSKGSVRIYRS